MKIKALYCNYVIVFLAFMCFAEVDVCAQGSRNLKPKHFDFESRGDGNDRVAPTLDYYSNQTRVGTFDVIDNCHNFGFLLGHKNGVMANRAVNLSTGEKYPALSGPRFGGYFDFDSDDVKVSELVSEVFSQNEIESIKAVRREDGFNCIIVWYAVNPTTGKVVDIHFNIIVNPKSDKKDFLSIPVERFEHLESLIKTKWLFPDAPEESKVFDYIPCGSHLF